MEILEIMQQLASYGNLLVRGNLDDVYAAGVGCEFSAVTSGVDL